MRKKTFFIRTGASSATWNKLIVNFFLDFKLKCATTNKLEIGITLAIWAGWSVSVPRLKINLLIHPYHTAESIQ